MSKESLSKESKRGDFKAGDKVEWKASQGMGEGEVKKKVTKLTKIKGHQVAASPDNPEYIVQSSKSGALASHKPGSLHKH